MRTKTVIGVSSIQYSQDGKVVSALFVPDAVNMHEKVQDIASELSNSVCDSTNPESIKENHEKVMANWFLSMQNFIDFAEEFDREKQKLTSRILRCEKYTDSQQVRLCIVEFSIEDIEIAQ